MVVQSFELKFDTSARTDVIDITDKVMKCLQRAKVSAGILVVFTPGSTAALTTIEYESGAVSDLLGALERLAPREIEYAHDRRWGDGNGYSHVRAALVKPDLNIPVQSGKMILGTWQQIVLLDFDNKPRQRRVVVQILGEGVDD